MFNNEKIANYSRYRGVIEVKSEVAPTPHVTRDAGQHSSASLYGAWEEFLATTGPYSHLWTLSYMHPYSDRRAIEGLWDCAKHLNRSLWGPRWAKACRGIRATVVAERHKLSQELRGRLHFHVLVQNRDLPTCDERFINLVNEAVLWLRDDFKRPMSDLARTDVRPVWSPQGLSDYLTKDLQTPLWPTGENIFFLRQTGVEGVVFPLRSNVELRSQH